MRAGTMKLLFSVNDYDRDGDQVDRGIWLHIDDTLSLKFENGSALEKFALEILAMLPEIKENDPSLFAQSKELCLAQEENKRLREALAKSLNSDR